MVDEAEAERLDVPAEDDEGGPVKSFLEHLEDLRWVLIKSLVALGIGVLICLLGGNFVVDILKRPLGKAKISYPGTNQVVTVLVGTNQLSVFNLTPDQEQRFNLGTNRFVAVTVEPALVGTNHVLAWNVLDDPALALRAQTLKIDLINLSPAGGFFV